MLFIDVGTYEGSIQETGDVNPMFMWIQPQYRKLFLDLDDQSDMDANITSRSVMGIGYARACAAEWWSTSI